VSNAEKQARWRAKRDALARSHPEVAERALLEQAERCEQLSAEQCHALADKLTALANEPSVAVAQACGGSAQGSAAGLAAGRAALTIAAAGLPRAHALVGLDHMIAAMPRLRRSETAARSLASSRASSS
jgi:hypothetical protein